MKRTSLFMMTILSVVQLSACNGSSESELDNTLTKLAAEQDLVGNVTEGFAIPDINGPLAQLGKQLFYSKSLSGQVDSACVSCHHPMLGGGDKLALGIGVDALDQQLLGPGRQVDYDHDGIADGTPPLLPRNAPTVFNGLLWTQRMFWDGRIEVLNVDEVATGADVILGTPDAGYGIADSNASDDLLSEQSKFPLTARHEMLGTFEDAVYDAQRSDSENRRLQRDALAARLADTPIDADDVVLNPNDWLVFFQLAFATQADAETLITQDNIAQAIGTFEQTMVFVDNPWFDYLHGDLDALSAQQKAGAILFYQDRESGGAGCSGCHSGYLFSNEQRHIIGFPQIGPGVESDSVDANGNYDDYGLESVSGAESDRYKFRTPTLLNIEVTGPYSHAGSVNSLEQAIRFCNDPSTVVDSYFDNHQWCELDYLSGIEECERLYPSGKTFTLNAIATRSAFESQIGLTAAPTLSDQQVAQIAAFLTALTDPCVKDRQCLLPWILEDEEVADDNMLYGVDEAGVSL